MAAWLGLDLDGVVCNYLAGLRAHLAASGRNPDRLPDPSTWSFVAAGWFPHEDAYQAAHAHAVEAGLYRQLPEIDGAGDALRRLHAAGARIVVITHRLLPNVDPHRVVSDTLHWLEEHRIPFDDVQFAERKSAAPADVYIDDAPHNIAQLVADGCQTIVYDQPYNQHAQAHYRAHGWQDAAERIKAWGRR